MTLDKSTLLILLGTSTTSCASTSFLTFYINFKLIHSLFTLNCALCAELIALLSLNVQVIYESRILFDELTSWTDLIAHQHFKDFICFHRIR